MIADCTGDNAGDSVGPSADGFETYGVTGVALITFILLGVKRPGGAGAVAGVDLRDAHRHAGLERRRRISSTAPSPRRGIGNADKMNFESPLTSLVWITSLRFHRADLLYFVFHYSRLWAATPTQWWKLATIISCGTLAGAVIPELVKVFTSTESRHVREVVASAQEGGASLGILSGFVAGNFSAYYLGLDDGRC